MDEFGNLRCADISENGTVLASVAYGNSSNITVFGPMPVPFQYFWLCSVESYLQAQVFTATGIVSNGISSNVKVSNQ